MYVCSDGTVLCYKLIKLNLTDENSCKNCQLQITHALLPTLHPVHVLCVQSHQTLSSSVCVGARHTAQRRSGGGGVHTDWSTDWSRGLTAIGTHCQHMTCGHTRSACPSSSPHHSYLCPPSLPLLPLFELQGSLGSGPAGLLLDRGAGPW